MSDITTTVGFEVDQGSVSNAKGALQAFSSDVQKAGNTDAFKTLAKDFADVAKQTGSTGSSMRLLVAELERLKATDDDIKSTVSAFNDYRKAVDQAVESTEKLDEAKKAFAETASAAVDPAGTGGGGGDGRNFLTRAGAQIRNLPSVQIPGLGIGTDAIGNFLRLGGALKDAVAAANLASKAEAALSSAKATLSTISQTITGVFSGEVSAKSVLAGITATLTGTTSSAAAGVVTLVASLSPLAVVGAALAGVVVGVGAAFALAAAQSRQAGEDLKAAYQKQREIQEFIRSGATTEEAKKKLEEEQQRLTDEQNNLAEAKAAYADAFAQLANSVPIVGDLFARIADLFGVGGFGVVKEEIATAEKNAKDAGQSVRFLNDALDKNKFAAADAKKAAEEKAKADEKAAREAKAAEEKAAREAEQQAERIKQAQEAIAKSNQDYSNKLADLATSAAQKLADLNQAARDKNADIQRKYNDDLNTIALKARRDESDAKTKAAQADYDALVKLQRDMDDVRKQAAKAELDSLRDRNFLAAQQAREGAADEQNKLTEQAQKDAADRAVAQQREAADRLLNLNRAREDRLTALNNENRDARIALQRNLRDAQINYQRQQDQARIAYQRQQQELRAHLNELTNLRVAGYAAEKAAAQGKVPNPAAVTGRNGNTTNNSTSITDNRSFGINGSLGGLMTVDQIQKMMLGTMGRLAY